MGATKRGGEMERKIPLNRRGRKGIRRHTEKEESLQTTSGPVQAEQDGHMLLPTTALVRRVGGSNLTEGKMSVC